MFLLSKRKVRLPIVLIGELYEIDWFHNCGKHEKPSLIFATQTAGQILSSEWESTILHYRGIVTESLSHRERHGLGNEYREWNKIVADFKKHNLPSLINLWKKKMQDYAISEKLIDTVRFDIITLVSVYAYAEIVDIPPFFEALLKVYKLGHIPCSYTEEQNGGAIIVF